MTLRAKDLKIYTARCLVIMMSAAAVMRGQSDSARYLWNSGAFRSGDQFLRSDAVDTFFLGGRQLFAISDAETSIVFPRNELSTFLDSGGIDINPKYSTILWNFPKAWEQQAGEYSFATLGIAPDEFQISMEGNSGSNRDICLYARRNVNLALRIPGDQSGDYKVCVVEKFNHGLSNGFDRSPFTIWSDRQYYGFGLVKFLELKPGYPTMGHPRDSVVILNMQIDTLFGAYGGRGSGYAKFLRAQLLDTVKFDIDISGAYRIAGGTEIRPKAVAADSLMVKYLVSDGERFAGRIYVDLSGSRRHARHIPGLTADYNCVVSLSGDDDGFAMVKGSCKNDSLIIRTSADYAGYVNYLLFLEGSSAWHAKANHATPVHRPRLMIWPTLTNDRTRMQYALSEGQRVRISIYDPAGRRSFECFEGYQDPGFYADELDLSGLSNGVYFLRLETATSQSSGKIVIVK